MADSQKSKGAMEQAQAPAKATRTPRQTTMLLAAALAVACLLCWFQWRSWSSQRSAIDSRVAQLDRMRADVTAIESLRDAPQAAASRSRPNEELLAQVEKSLSATGIGKNHWHDSIPQPVVRLPKSDYKKFATRLYFETITLRQLATFAHHLETADPTLGVSALNITNRKPDAPDYDIDLTISYLVYEPLPTRSAAG